MKHGEYLRSIRGDNALLQRHSVLVKACCNVEELNFRNNTRPEAQPRHIVDSDTATVFGRYSGGNQSKFSEFQVIQVRSVLILYASNRGDEDPKLVGSISAAKERQILPLPDLRYNLVMSTGIGKASFLISSP